MLAPTRITLRHEDQEVCELEPWQVERLGPSVDGGRAKGGGVAEGGAACRLRGGCLPTDAG